MTSTRLHTHSSFPAPNPHAGASSAQSKSHVLAGVQDAYWSDDEAEDAECPLCLEEMDIADLNFKPCLCGYQICRFCWHHIKENLNGRCPACRRDYSDENVQFKPINKEDHKRLTQQKKQRERERKDLEVLGRRQLANVRVVQRNVVYVLGMGPRFAKEELIPTLRSNEYFGQYGKISKIVLVKRTSSGGRTPVVGLYITYHRREDAARAIAAVDGATSPGGGSDVMRASYGTAKYCMTFLRGNSCNDHSCMNLHEWGDEKDCFTKEDLSTLKHTMKDMENRPRTTVTGKKAEDSDAGLPRGASWAQKGATASHGSPFSVIQAASTSTSSRQPRRGTGTRQPRGAASPAISAATRRTAVALGSPKPASQASSSRPSTPAVPRAATSAEAKPVRQKEPPAAQSPHPSPPRSPTSSAAIESDVGSGSGLPEVVTAPPAVRPQSTDSAQSSVPSVPPGLPTVPPGLSAPPGLPPPKRITSPQSSLVPSISQSSYQMSTQARALLDDVKARWEAPLPTSVSSPFPDFDRMLQMLSGDGGGFSFNLDPKLAGDTSDSPDVTGLDSGPSIPFQGSYMDAFPGLRPPNQQPSNPYMSPPPGLVYSPTPSSAMYNPLAASGGDSLRPDSAGASSYTGSFNPFADGQEDSKSPSRHDSLDDDRKVSRFNFARGRQGSTTTSSPLHTTAPLGANDNVSHGPFYNSPRLSSPSIHSQPQWTVQTRQHVDYPHHHPPSAMSSPLAQHAQAYPQPTSRFQPFDEGVSEAQLRDFIQSSRDRVNPRNPQYDQPPPPSYRLQTGQPFNDPAIMSSARFMVPATPPGISEGGYPISPSVAGQYSATLQAPPGLGFPPRIASSPALSSVLGHGTGSGPSTNLDMSQTGGSAYASRPDSPTPPPPILSSSDFPALTAEPQSLELEEPQSPVVAENSEDSKALAKAERKAAKKAAAAERAAERQRVAQERATVKAAEKARLAEEKAKAATLKAEQEKVERERLEKERAEKEKAEKERLEKERVVKERLEKEKTEREAAEREKAEKKAEKARVTQLKKLPSTSTPSVSSGSPKTPKASGTPKIKGSESPRSGSPASVKPPAVVKPPSRQLTKDMTSPSSTPVPAGQVPILSRLPKKNKPVAKPIKIPKEEDASADTLSIAPSTTVSEAPRIPLTRVASTAEVSSSNSRSQSGDRTPPNEPASLTELLADIEVQCPWMNISTHPFFDVLKINPAAKMPLEYGPLVHALSALSVGGGSFANNMPSGSIDNAVSSFQQLLETLTQTISDLLRLLPRTTWDDSSSFDGVLRDMLKGDDFLDDGAEDGSGKEDEVAALTLALERRARWMEVQLSKLEELHRDINTAAVRAVLAFNDNGWDHHGFMPRVGNTLQRFDKLGMVEEHGISRSMSVEELEKKLAVAKEAAVFAETEMREAMDRLEDMRPSYDDEL